MAKYIETGTNYAYSIKRIKNITFQTLRKVAIDFINRLPPALVDELYEDIQHGVCQLQSEPELNMYLRAFGLMHEAKLQYAFEHLPNDFTNHSTIDIVDYGCGQAIGTICYADFLRKNGYAQKVRKITLIEPSEIALKRAALHASCFFPNTEIITINKGFDDLDSDDICTNINTPTLHILSNVIDLADEYFNLQNFAELLNSNAKGENHYICIEPYFDYEERDAKLKRFTTLMTARTYYRQAYAKGAFITGRDWTCNVVMLERGTYQTNSTTNYSTKAVQHREAAKQGNAETQNRHYDYNNLIDGTKINIYTNDFDKYIEAIFPNSENAAINKIENILNLNRLEAEILFERWRKFYLIAYEPYEEWVPNYPQETLTVEQFKERMSVPRIYVKKNINTGLLYFICNNNIMGEVRVNGIPKHPMISKFIVPYYSKACWVLHEEGDVQGQAEAQYTLGCCYSDNKNYTEAVKWYRKAAEQGLARAQYELGICYATNIGVKGDYPEAAKWYRKAAEQGDARAQNSLGFCYANGRGVEQDYTEAVKWYRKAAEQGYSMAQNNLGVCYANGQGVEQDYTEAVKWYRKVAEQGDATAQFNLGIHYDNGQGVEQDYTEAVKWYRKAPEQGDATAQLNLGSCYYNGEGVEQNYTEAVKWFRKAAEQGDADGQNNLGFCYANGQGIEQDYTEAVKWYHKAAEQGDAEAVKWFRKAAEQGNAEAQYGFGLCYHKGLVVEQNYTEAVKWYRKAAEQGYAKAQYKLGNCYCFGQGIKLDYVEAVKWYRKAAEQGDTKAQFNLGIHYEVVEQDYTEAVKWFRKAAEQGHTKAQFDLGVCYHNGLGVDQDYTEAVKWYRKAAEQGDANGQNNLGYCYYNGQGVYYDYTEAVKWFRKAAEQGHTEAQTKLKLLTSVDVNDLPF